MDSASTRSSITLAHESAVDAEIASLEEDILAKETRLEKYGADDVHDPHFHHSRPPSVHVGDDKTNPNLVTFDGPNDPLNPQNWSNGYKWFLTAICCVLTFDV